MVASNFSSAHEWDNTIKLTFFFIIFRCCWPLSQFSIIFLLLIFIHFNLKKKNNESTLVYTLKNIQTQVKHIHARTLWHVYAHKHTKSKPTLDIFLIRLTNNCNGFTHTHTHKIIRLKSMILFIYLSFSILFCLSLSLSFTNPTHPFVNVILNVYFFVLICISLTDLTKSIKMYGAKVFHHPSE